MESISARHRIVNFPPCVSQFLGKEIEDVQWFQEITTVEDVYLKFNQIVPGQKIGYHSRGKVTWGVVSKREERGGQFFWLSVEGREVRIHFSTRRLFSVEVQDAVPIN